MTARLSAVWWLQNQTVKTNSKIYKKYSSKKSISINQKQITWRKRKCDSDHLKCICIITDNIIRRNIWTPFRTSQWPPSGWLQNSSIRHRPLCISRQHNYKHIILHLNSWKCKFSLEFSAAVLETGIFIMYTGVRKSSFLCVHVNTLIMTFDFFSQNFKLFCSARRIQSYIFDFSVHIWASVAAAAANNLTFQTETRPHFLISPPKGKVFLKSNLGLYP